MAVVRSIAQLLAPAGEKCVGVFSLEMGREQLLQRLMTLEQPLDHQTLRTGDLRQDELRMAAQAMGAVTELPIVIDDSAALSITELQRIARQAHQQRPLAVIVVDYLQLLTSQRGRDNRVQEVGDISRGLKALAMELSVPVVALSQLSRAVEGRTEPVPRLSDLRESGALEQDADNVIFIHRPGLYDKDADKGLAEIHVAKQRNGPTGIAALGWDATRARFLNLETHRQPEGY
jgi:replicative DNA helicase